MSDIPIPQKGSPITLEWGKAVTESCNAVRAIGTGGLVRSGPFGLGEAPLPANRRDRRLQSKLTPFAIKLKQKTDDAEAQWIIYLPSEEILSYNNEVISPLSDLAAADGMDHWYVLNIALTGGTVYLNISTGNKSESGSESKSDESSPSTVEYSLEKSEKISIAIADVAYDEQTKSASIRQYVASVLHLGGGDCDGVKSLNELKDDIEIVGGDEILVTKDGQKIIISYKKDEYGDDSGDDSGESEIVATKIIAGAGIKITDNGGGAVTISAEGLEEDDDAGTEKVLSVIVDMRYDAETHKFQCKRRMITFKGSFVGSEPEWEDVFEATSHKGEHSSEI